MFNFQQSGYLKPPLLLQDSQTHAVLQGLLNFFTLWERTKTYGMEVSRHITLVTKWPLRWLTGSLTLVIRDLKVIVNVD